MSTSSERKTRQTGPWGAVVLTVLLAIATAASAAYVRILPLGVAGCGEECDYDQISTAVNVFYIAATAILLLTIAGVVIFRHSRGVAMAVPALGFILLAVMFWLCTGAAEAGMQPE